MKACLSIVAIVFIPGVGVFEIESRRKVQQFKDKNVIAGELRSPLQSIFAHLSEDQYLTVNDKTYTHLRGIAPFYLNISLLHSILFVTGEVDQEATFHIFDLSSKKEKSIAGGPEGFGWDIGASRKDGEPWTDYILKASSNRIILVEEGSNSKTEIELNLDTLTMEQK